MCVIDIVIYHIIMPTQLSTLMWHKLISQVCAENGVYTSIHALNLNLGTSWILFFVADSKILSIIDNIKIKIQSWI